MMGYMYCQNNHELKWSNSGMGYFNNTYNCNTCHQSKPCGPGRWNCQGCQYDVCPTCRPAPGGQPMPPMPAPVPFNPYNECKNKHGLQWSNSGMGYMANTFSCDICHQSKPCGPGRWNCSSCKYDVCPNCRPGPVQAPPFNPYMECKNRHPLTWSNSAMGYMGNSFSCDICHQSKGCGPGRWNCASCKYDVCPNCRPPAPAPINPYMECRNRHQLNWSCGAMGYSSNVYSCDICHQSKGCGPGRWNCASCKYDVCPNCRPSPAPAPTPINPYMECKSRHPLQWSCSAHGYMGHTFNCDTCKKSHPIGPGRWNCVSCKYDVCHNCRPAPGPQPMPGGPMPGGPMPQGGIQMSMGFGMPSVSVGFGGPMGFVQAQPQQYQPQPQQYQAQPMGYVQAQPQPAPFQAQFGMVQPQAQVSMGVPPLPSGGPAMPTQAVGGHSPMGTTFNDYLSFAMNCLSQGKAVNICDLEIYAGNAGEILSMEVKYEVPKDNGAFTGNYEKMHGKSPGSFMLPHENKHFFSGEYITCITGRHNGNNITKLCFMYNKGKALEIGQDMGMEFNLMIPPGKKVVALATEFTDKMMNIGAYYV